MKFIVTISLAILFLVQSFTRTFIVINYEMNKEYIANVLCENKDNKAMHCEGKCHLKKEFQKEEKKENTSSGSSKEKTEDNLISQKTNDITFPGIQRGEVYFKYTEIKSQHYKAKIVHPPTLSAELLF